MALAPLVWATEDDDSALRQRAGERRRETVERGVDDDSVEQPLLRRAGDPVAGEDPRVGNPEPGEALGHQHEYTLEQMRWQMSHSDLKLISAEYYEDGFKGASTKARIAWTVTKPATLVPHWRDGLMLVGRA